MKNIPKHIGIILDGNRRWARGKKMSTFEGHRLGYENVKTITKHAFNKGIKILTIYAFSTENWNRDKLEVKYLMSLLKLLVKKEVNILHKQGVKVNIFGRLKDFDQELQQGIVAAQEKTKNNKKGILNICLSYGGRDEIVRAVNEILKEKSTSQVSEKIISEHLDSRGLPDPDLIIRTSGEQRLSGFLTWQSVYSEFYFPKKDWPAFTTKDFDQAIENFSNRKRRFGGN
ncbi:di-trans,poly-cis-decaprenylcistransferase [bacterium]|nr:di-trans,poly-cis-decaprenylcistransferase [bacterium]